MKLLVIVNNHNSFGILDLCTELRRLDSNLEVEAVCAPEFLAANFGHFGKRGITPHHLDPIIGASTGSSAKVLSGVKALEDQARSPELPGSSGFFRRAANILAKVLFNTSVYAMARELRISRRLVAQQRRAVALLTRLQPSVVLSLSDRSHDYVESAILWAARSMNIPIVLPYVAQFDIDASLAYRTGPDGKPLQELRPFEPFSLYKLWSYFRLHNQVYKGTFFQAPFILNAARRCGTLSSYPWWVGNGISDIVCVDSQHTLDQYVANRVARDKIAIMGHIQLDSIFHSYRQRADLRQRLVEKYGLQSDKALLVLSVPQYAEQGYIAWPEHWREIDSIVNNASKAGQNLLLSVHPRSDISQYRYLAERFNCCILSESLAEIIGAADLFLASNSTTFVWSVLCGIPTIALKSPVRFLYDYLPSIRQVDDSNGLCSSINDMLTGPGVSFERDWHLLSREAVFDGRYNERFIALLMRATRPGTIDNSLH